MAKGGMHIGRAPTRSYRAILLGGGGRGAAEHAGNGAGALGGAAGASVARVVTREEGSNGLKLLKRT
jgi:hypothetical protein